MTETIDVLLCYRQSRNVSRKTFRTHWREERAALVGHLKEDLGYSGYSQVHRATRLNPLYLGIRLSRSWPFAVLFSLIRGRGAPPFCPASGGDLERWDAVEILSFPSLSAAREALGTERGAKALKALRIDADPFSRNGAAFVTLRLTVTEKTPIFFPRTVTLFFLRPRPPMDRDAMLGYWKTQHKALVEKLTAAMGHRSYRQLHVRPDDDGESGLLAPFGASMPAPYSGVAYLGYTSQWSLIFRLVDPRLHIANTRLIKDEVGFIDLGSSSLVFGTEIRP